MITISEYAKQKGVSYEAINAQIHRNKEYLKGHIVKKGRTRYLTDKAVTFLNEKRQDNPVIVQQVNIDEELENLRVENKNLLIKVAELQEKLIGEQEAVKLLQEEKIILLENAAEKKKGFLGRLFR